MPAGVPLEFMTILLKVLGHTSHDCIWFPTPTCTNVPA